MLILRDHRQVDILVGQKPSKKLPLRKIPKEVALNKICKLRWLHYALTADSQEFNIVYLPQLLGKSKKMSRKRSALMHIRYFHEAKRFALQRISEKIQFLYTHMH